MYRLEGVTMQHLHVSIRTFKGGWKQFPLWPWAERRYTITARGRAYLRQLRVEEEAAESNRHASGASGVVIAPVANEDLARV